jgi:hypothetical protein
LKTYSSDEGRCIKTAAAFLKGFLNISGGLAPIITSMVNFTKKAQSTHLINSHRIARLFFLAKSLYDNGQHSADTHQYYEL